MKYRKSSDFYRLEKRIDRQVVGVYEFHTVVNGNMYYRYFEEIDGRQGYLGEIKKVRDREQGNRVYKRLKADGYKFAGIYEMDICGYKYKKEA